MAGRGFAISHIKLSVDGVSPSLILHACIPQNKVELKDPEFLFFKKRDKRAKIINTHNKQSLRMAGQGGIYLPLIYTWMVSPPLSNCMHAT